ncbi:ATP-binding protein [Elusimicrobiota bacterium]
MKIKFFYKFIIVMVLISVVPLTIVGLRMVKINMISQADSTRHNHASTAGFLAGSIDDFVRSLREKLLFLIKSQSVRTLSFTAKQTLIQSLLSSTEHFITVSMVNKTGEEFVKTYHPDYASEAEILNIYDRALFKKALKGPAISDVYQKKNEPRMDIIYPVGVDYIFITLTLKKLWNNIRGADIGKMGQVFLVDSEGKILAHPDSALEGKKIDIPTVRAVLSRASIGSMEFDIDGKKMVGSYAPVENMGWGIITQQPYEYAYESAIRGRKAAYQWIFIVIIVSVVVSYFFAKGLTNPIFTLIKGAGRVANGNFKEGVTIRTNDELQMLAKTFNEMVASLKKYSEIQVDKLLAEQTKTQAILFSIEDGIVLTDFEGRILLVNQRAKELLEFDFDPAEGDKIFQYISDRDDVKKIFETLKNYELDLSDDENRKIIQSVADEVKTSSGKIIGNMRIIRDITLERELEEIKEKFMHSITHDLKNPLAAIIGMSDLLRTLRGKQIEDSEKKYFDILKSEAERLLGMINDILHLAKLQSGTLKLNKRDFNLTGLLIIIKDTFSAQAEQVDVEIECPDADEVYTVSADENLVRRVIINLLGNSMKYTPRGGKIQLLAEKKDRSILVSVKDNGEGMPTDMCEKIFDRFQQIKGQSRGGTGIGLNVSKEIVEAHGGKIWAESSPGQGSVFTFTLPE